MPVFAPTPPMEKVLVRFLKPVIRYVGADGAEYGPYEKDEVAEILEVDATTLIKEGYAVKVETVPVVPPPLPKVRWKKPLRAKCL